MAFNDKLTHLLKHQSISNSRLSKALSVDPSLVSRWKSGERPLAPCSPFVSAIAHFVVTQCRTIDQRLNLIALLGTGDTSLAETHESAHAALLKWLTEDIAATHQWIDQFLENISLPPSPSKDFTPYVPLEISRPVVTEVYAGPEGKRSAVLKLLSAVIAHDTPLKMLLFSDESIDWLTSDPVFTNTWGMMILKAIQKGHRIQIVHTIHRDLSEMLSAIINWMPLYMTGAIEPYYDPKYKETPFKRTHFLAPGIALISSTSVKGCEDITSSFYITDPEILRANETMYDGYMSHCKPLMHIFTLNSLMAFRLLQLEFENDPSTTSIYTTGLSSWTLPSQTLRRILTRLQFKDEMITEALVLHEKRVQIITEQLKTNTRMEIVYLPQSPTDVSLFAPKDLLIPIASAYTFEDYEEHLAHTMSMSAKYSNFELVSTDQCVMNDIHLTVKKNTGVFLIRTGAYPIAFAFNQPNLTEAFTNYMDSIYQCCECSNSKK